MRLRIATRARLIRCASLLALGATACRPRTVPAPASSPVHVDASPAAIVDANTRDAIPSMVAPAFTLPASVDYETYANDRFDYSVRYPTFLVPQRESDMGDGREFVAAQHARMWVSGMWNADMSTTDELLQSAEERRRQTGWRVTMRRRLPHGFVLSGVMPGRIFYEYQFANDEARAEVGFEYDERLRESMDPVIATVVHSLVPPTHASAPEVAAAIPATLTCSTAQLRITLGEEDDAAGHRAIPVRFRNVGPSSCQMSGYPSVVALDRHDARVEQARQTPSGYSGGLTDPRTPPAVTVAPGHTASALIEARATRADGSSCVAYAALSITAPANSDPIHLAWNTDACSSLQVHPVVLGATGREP